MSDSPNALGYIELQWKRAQTKKNARKAEKKIGGNREKSDSTRQKNHRSFNKPIGRE